MNEEKAEPDARANDPACHESCLRTLRAKQGRGSSLTLGKKEMKLIEAVQQIAKLDADLTIYAREPWSPSTEVQLAVEGSPEEKKFRADGLRYFLEVFIARDFLDDWRATQKKQPSDEQSCARLIEYAANDA